MSKAVAMTEGARLGERAGARGTRISSALAATGGEFLHRCPVDQIRRNDSDAAARPRPQCRRSLAALEHGTLAEDRARPDLRDLLAVHRQDQNAVEQQVELVSGLALLDEDLVRLELP